MNLRGTFSPSLRIASWDESNPQILMRLIALLNLEKVKQTKTRETFGEVLVLGPKMFLGFH